VAAREGGAGALSFDSSGRCDRYADGIMPVTVSTHFMSP
jgi:hypothetical protein